MFGAPALVPANPLPSHVPHDQNHDTTTTTTTTNPTTCLCSQGEAAWPTRGINLRPWMSQWIQLCWFIRCAQVQVSNSGRRKLRAPARKAFGKPLEYGYSYVVYFRICLLSNLVGLSSAQIKIISAIIKMVVITITYYQW